MVALKNAICHPADALPWLPLTKKGGRWQIPLAHICVCMYVHTYKHKPHT